MKIYISGKISDLDYGFAVRKFRESEVLVDKNYPNSPVINPLDILPLFNIERWLFWMIAYIYQLLKCDAILLQPDWVDSKGAKIEVIVSILTRKQIIIENDIQSPRFKSKSL